MSPEARLAVGCGAHGSSLDELRERLRRHLDDALADADRIRAALAALDGGGTSPVSPRAERDTERTEDDTAHHGGDAPRAGGDTARAEGGARHAITDALRARGAMTAGELAAWFPTTIEGDRAAGAALTFGFEHLKIDPMRDEMLACETASAVTERTLRLARSTLSAQGSC